MEDSRSKRIGFIGTVLFHAGIIALLFYFGFRTTLPLPEEEGIVINFGNTDQGAGNKRPAPAQSRPARKSKPSPKKKETVKPVKETVSSPKEKILTQNTEDAPALPSAEEMAIKKAKKEKEEQLKKQEDLAKKIESEKRRLEEQTRLEEEKAEQERLAEEARQEKITSINNKTKNAFGSGTSNASSQGKTFPSGNQGQKIGSPDSNNYTSNGLGNKGYSFDLEGRNSISIPKPNYNLQESGKVVVEVTVDRNGKVTNARSGVSGSTTTNMTLIEAAKQAALKAKFNSDNKAPAYQRGTITYHFQLD